MIHNIPQQYLLLLASSMQVRSRNHTLTDDDEATSKLKRGQAGILISHIRVSSFSKIIFVIYKHGIDKLIRTLRTYFLSKVEFVCRYRSCPFHIISRELRNAHHTSHFHTHASYAQPENEKERIYSGLKKAP